MEQSNVIAPERFLPSDSVMASQVGDEVVLLDLNSGIYHSLNAVGAPIWTALSQGRSQPEIVEAIVREFDVAPAIAARDVEAFLSRLLALGLVTRA